MKRIMIEEQDYQKLPHQLRQGLPLCRVIRKPGQLCTVLRKQKPYVGVLKLHPQFRVK